MKAITIHQPWAWLIAEGVKPYENRSWKTAYRGPLAIHVGAPSTWKEAAVVATLDDLVESGMLPADRRPTLEVLRGELGQVIAVSELRDCKTSEEAKAGPGGAWVNDSGFAFDLADVRRVKPIALTGKQQLFNVEDDVAEQLQADAGEGRTEPMAPPTYAITWEELVGEKPTARPRSNDEEKAAQRGHARRVDGYTEADLERADRGVYQHRPHGDLPLEQKWAVRVTMPGGAVLYDSARVGDDGLFELESEAWAHLNAWDVAQAERHQTREVLRAARRNMLPERLDESDGARDVMERHKAQVQKLIKECHDDSLTLRAEARDPEVAITMDQGAFVVAPAKSLTDGTIGRRWWGAAKVEG
jgi:hypothetical protein